MADEFERADSLAARIASGNLHPNERVFVINTTISPDDLAMPVGSEGSVNLVRYGYNEPTRALDFRAGFYMGRGVMAACEVIGEYNSFDSGRVVSALTSLAKHQQLRNRIEVGRSSSPAIWLYLTGSADEMLCEQIMLGAQANGINLYEIDPGHRVMRVSWD